MSRLVNYFLGILFLCCPEGMMASPLHDLSQKAISEGKGRHYVTLLPVGQEALLARVHLIRQATESIKIQTFIWANDETGRYLAWELLQAAKRGVTVSLLADPFASIRDPELVAFMTSAHPNFHIRFYNPSTDQLDPDIVSLTGLFAKSLKEVNQRMHNKVFLVDDAVFITGGRNYENDYYDYGRTRNFKDRDVLVCGPVAEQVRLSFASYWESPLVVKSKDMRDIARLLQGNKVPSFKDRQSFQIGSWFDPLDSAANDLDVIREKLIETAIPVDRLAFIWDEPGKNQNPGLTGGGRTTQTLVDLLAKAKKRILVQTPYLVFDQDAIDVVKELRSQIKGLDIRISSNSLAATDSVYSYAFSYKQKKIFLKKLKMQIFEYKPVPKDIGSMMPSYHETQGQNKKAMQEDQFMCIHAKSFIVDDTTTWIGSYNVDPRSAHLNTEVGLIIWNQQVTQKVSDDILRDMAPQNSWTIAPKKVIPVLSRVSGFCADVFHRVPFFDIWPFRYAASFELKSGSQELPYTHPDFFEHYEHVGSFPGVEGSSKEIQTRLIKALGGAAEPLI